MAGDEDPGSASSCLGRLGVGGGRQRGGDARHGSLHLHVSHPSHWDGCAQNPRAPVPHLGDTGDGFYPPRAQLGVTGGEEQFHVQLELQRESGGSRDLIASAGRGPRPPRLKHLSVAGGARGVLIVIIHQALGTWWCAVHALS